jgi:AcrR family transcriptional regulator
MMLESGYPSLTIEGVARRSGVAKSTIYRWWRSKAELVVEASAEHVEIGLVPHIGDPREEILVAARQLIRTFSDPITRVVMTAVIANLDEDPWLPITFRDRWVYPWRQSAAEALARAQERGAISSEADLALLLDVLVGTVFQRTVTVASPAVDGLDEQLVDLIMAS